MVTILFISGVYLFDGVLFQYKWFGLATKRLRGRRLAICEIFLHASGTENDSESRMATDYALLVKVQQSMVSTQELNPSRLLNSEPLSLLSSLPLR